jgi:hypothetical protein
MRKSKQTSRWALARRLQDLALRIATARPIRVGGKAVRVPDRFLLEEEFESTKGEHELELELKWRAPHAPKRTPGKRGR